MCTEGGGDIRMYFDDPVFWRAGAISTIAVMSIVLIMLTIDSLSAISPGGSHVPPYTVINQHIDYKFDSNRGFDVPVISGAEPLFGKSLDESAAATLIDQGKMVIQSRACIDCHTFFGNGAYYAPDLTKAWLDPEQYRTWTRTMPNLGVSEEEAQALVAYLKWMSAVDTNGFPPNFNQIEQRR